MIGDPIIVSFSFSFIFGSRGASILIRTVVVIGVDLCVCAGTLVRASEFEPSWERNWRGVRRRRRVTWCGHLNLNPHEE